MRRTALLLYQCCVGLSDTVTGVLLLVAPATTLRWMGVPAIAPLILLSYVGAFVLGVGLSCFYGAFLVAFRGSAEQLKAVWLMTGLIRICVALFVGVHVLQGSLDVHWSTVACTDGAIAVLQFTGLAKGWLDHASGR